MERKRIFEYTALKADAGSRIFQSYLGTILGNSIPVTFLGTGWVNLPSKMTYAETYDLPKVVKLNEYTYTTSADGGIIAIDDKTTWFRENENVVSSEKTEIISTCR